MESILAQTYPYIKVVLVDDGSQDNSGTICDEYAANPAVRVIHQTNKGLAGARNTGIELAIKEAGEDLSGNLIAFVDSDDTIHPEMIAVLAQLYQITDAVIVGAQAKTVSEEETIVFEKIDSENYELIPAHEFARLYLTHQASVSVCDKLFELSLFRQLRFAQGRLNEDGLLLYEMILSHNCTYAHCPYPIYYYLMRNGSITRSGFGKNIVDMVGNFLNIEKMTETYAGELKKEANDNVLYACAVFCNTVPLCFFAKKADTVVSTVIHEVRKRKKTIGNSDLKSRDKTMLKLFSVFPLCTIFLISCYRMIHFRKLANK